MVQTLDRIDVLQSQQQSVLPEDGMAEAGRKALLSELVKMLQHEAGSRTGEDIEDVHIMRVTIRRMRSLLRLLEAYYKDKEIRSYSQGLSRVAWALGSVRDLDVLIEDLKKFQLTLNADQQASLQEIVDTLDQRRNDARQELNHLLDSKSYRRFVRDFSDFLTRTLEKGKPKAIVPYQVRHVLPMMIYERLAAVRAYETVIHEADDKTLHALRIEFKRLRYAVSLFEEVMGDSIKDFITELKTMQDQLGRLNDIHVARERLESWLDGLNEGHAGTVAAYITYLETEEPALRAGLPAAWERFNTRKVQQKLASAILALR